MDRDYRGYINRFFHPGNAEDDQKWFNEEAAIFKNLIQADKADMKRVSDESKQHQTVDKIDLEYNPVARKLADAIDAALLKMQLLVEDARARGMTVNS